MTNDKLVLLGTKGGPAIRAGGPNPTSSLLVINGQPMVIDCALGVTRGLVDAGLPLRDLSRIFITHLHSDHVLELGGLIHTAWTSGLSTPVTIYGPIGTRALWDGFRASLSFDIAIRVVDEGRPDLAQMVTVVEIGEGEVCDVGGVRVTALRVDHPPVTECYALRFDTDGWSVTFSSDTAYFPPLAPFAAGSDILVHEAMLLEGVDRVVRLVPNGARIKAHILASHTEAKDAGQIAADADVAHLVLHHLLPADDPELGEADFLREVRKSYAGQVTIPQDGQVITRKDSA